MKKIIVIHHSADFDGLFCREIARRFLGDSAEYIGWDYGQPKVVFQPEAERIYILDLSPECLGGDSYDSSKLVWIDHHKSAIEKFPATIPGYRIDGVAACRLAWQWFDHGLHDLNAGDMGLLPDKNEFIQRLVEEPEAVRLAGEYDIWDKRDPEAEVFQLGLRSVPSYSLNWSYLLNYAFQAYVDQLIENGWLLQTYVNQQDAELVKALGFLVTFEGLKFLALNSSKKGSLQFAARDIPATGHDALLKFNWTGSTWDFSLYHAKHRTDLDLSAIAVKYGGGGHRGACGFRMQNISPIIYGAIYS